MSENKKPIFNVLFADDNSCGRTLEFLKNVFSDYEINVILKNQVIIKDLTLENLKKSIKPDLVVFTGGEDVDPSIYGEKKGKFTYSNPTRDHLEIETFNNISFNVPKLGICRGAQLLTVLNQGKLIQHVENHNNSNHRITMTQDSDYEDGYVYNISLPSDHHQMMYPYNLKDDQYELLAHSEFFLSETYLNGNNEEIKLPNNFLEPEIVYYKNNNSLAIQPHPEWIQDFKTSKEFTIIKNLILTKLFKK